MTHYTKSAIIVSSCQARNCHPETCCCDEDEYAIMDYKKYEHHEYYGVVCYGTKIQLQKMLNENC